MEYGLICFGLFEEVFVGFGGFGIGHGVLKRIGGWGCKLGMMNFTAETRRARRRGGRGEDLVRGKFLC